MPRIGGQTLHLSSERVRGQASDQRLGNPRIIFDDQYSHLGQEAVRSAIGRAPPYIGAMSAEASPSAVSVEEFNEYIVGLGFIDVAPIVEKASQDRVLIRVPTAEVPLRPGGYIPGPTMMAAADLAGWFLVFTRNGITPMALTWDLKINFLRPAHGADLMVDARQTKFGKLCHASLDLFMDGDPGRLVAHATTTYALPSS